MPFHIQQLWYWIAAFCCKFWSLIPIFEYETQLYEKNVPWRILVFCLLPLVPLPTTKKKPGHHSSTSWQVVTQWKSDVVIWSWFYLLDRLLHSRCTFILLQSEIELVIVVATTTSKQASHDNQPTWIQTSWGLVVLGSLRLLCTFTDCRQYLGSLRK